MPIFSKKKKGRFSSVTKSTINLFRTVGFYASEPEDTPETSCPIKRSRSFADRNLMNINNAEMKIRHSHSDRLQSSDKCNQSTGTPLPCSRKSLPILSALNGTSEKLHISHSAASALSSAVNGCVPALAQSRAIPEGSTVPPPAMTKRTTIREFSPHLSKSRLEKFHKLFKVVPDDEYPIDYFSCAFKGDILLQGFMYVSPNWVCFYSRIKGRGRRLEIPLDKVISVTREKMALFIPNAIGIQTADKKYVFGSFMSRDTTYRLLVELWKLTQDSETVPSIEEQTGGSLNLCNDNNNMTHSNTDTSDETDTSVFMQCGSVDVSDREGVAEGDCQQCKDPSSPPEQKGEGGRFVFFTRCLDCQKTFQAFCQFAVKLQKIPRTNLLLAVCSVLVFFLLMSAVGLTYKILVIQAKLEMRTLWTPEVRHGFRESVMSSIYSLQSDSHTAVVKQLHSVLKSNIQLLEEVHASLKNLHIKSVLERCQDYECK